LRAALPLSAKDIRCTSVDGYKLAAGTNSDEQLRQEVFLLSCLSCKPRVKQSAMLVNLK